MSPMTCSRLPRSELRMKSGGGKRAGNKAVNARDLAEMGLCEKQAQLRHQLGSRTTMQQAARIQNGRRAHSRYLEEGVAATCAADLAAKGFTATTLFGNLVKWLDRRIARDYVLMRSIAKVVIRRWTVFQRPIRECQERSSGLRQDPGAANRGPD